MPFHEAFGQRGRGSVFQTLAAILIIILAVSGCANPNVPLSRPNGVAPSIDGSLYVMDFGNHRVVRLADDGRVEVAFGSFGIKANQIYHGWDMAIDSQGNLYFGNMVRVDEGTIHDGVKVFSPEGNYLRELGGTDYDPTSDAETANIPYSLDIDRQDRIYVADYGTCALRVFSPDGTLLATYFDDPDSEIAFTGPADIAVDDTRSLLYVSDFDEHLVHQFQIVPQAGGSFKLEHLQTIGEYGRGPGKFAYPQNLAVDDETGRLYVGDQANRRIQVFDAGGQYLSSLAPPGVTDWQVMGLAVRSNGEVLAADALNNVIWVFSPNGQDARRVEVGL